MRRRGKESKGFEPEKKEGRELPAYSQIRAKKSTKPNQIQGFPKISTQISNQNSGKLSNLPHVTENHHRVQNHVNQLQGRTVRTKTLTLNAKIIWKIKETFRNPQRVGIEANPRGLQQVHLKNMVSPNSSNLQQEKGIRVIPTEKIVSCHMIRV